MLMTFAPKTRGIGTLALPEASAAPLTVMVAPGSAATGVRLKLSAVLPRLME